MGAADSVRSGNLLQDDNFAFPVKYIEFHVLEYLRAQNTKVNHVLEQRPPHFSRRYAESYSQVGRRTTNGMVWYGMVCKSALGAYVVKAISSFGSGIRGKVYTLLNYFVFIFLLVFFFLFLGGRR